MDHKQRLQLLNSLVRAIDGRELSRIMAELGDSADIGLDTPFGEYDLCWHAFGNNPSNISTIGLGTKPGKSLSERITNAIDAILEDRAQSLDVASLPTSPRIAAQEWFGRPMTGPEQGLFAGLPGQTDRRIAVVILDSGIEDSPTIDVIDDGVGLLPDELPGTILSLQAGNKIKKRHQIGAFGQGGSASLGFADYVVIISRSRKDISRIAYTVIRVLRLDSTYKEDCYAYLVRSIDQSTRELLSVDTDDELQIYRSDVSPKLPPFNQGTLVRHINYRLGAISKALAPMPGNLYHYLHYNLFDPILPFRVADLRRPDKVRNELVTGSRNRLMRLSIERSATEEDSEARVLVKHHRPMEYITPLGGDRPCIGVEYWVVFAFKKKGERLEMRSNSSELFVQPNHPIIGTLNGQTQGELTAQFLKEIGLTLLSKHMVIHIDAADADTRVRRELFSTNREGFKDGPILEGLVSSIKRMVEDDAKLFDIEKELTERLAKREASATRDEVRQQVTRLLKEAGLQVSEQAISDAEGKGKVAPVQRPKAPRPIRPDPLPTLPFPQVTKFEIVHPEDLLQVHINDSELVIVETNADAEYDTRGLIHIRTEPPALEIESKSKLRGGRIRWRLRPISGVEVGVAGELIATLTKPDGSQLRDSRAFEILPLREKPSKKSQAQVPPFDIEPIDPADSERWDWLWPEDMGDLDRQRTHGYKVFPAEGRTIVFYSSVFGPYVDMLEKLKATNPTIVETFTVNYEIWIGYHAIIQHQSSVKRTDFSGDEEKLQEFLDQERALVARMQVKQAYTMAELMRKSASATID